MTKISFVCPIFNKKKYINLVLSSIKRQVGSFEKEYIFINDGSTDGSLEYLKKQTQKWKNTLILTQKNKGPAVATQVGINRAKGDYIKLVGGDDIMSPYCCEILLKTILKKKSVAAFSSYKLLQNYNNISFETNIVKNFRFLENPLAATIASSFSGTTPNLYCNKTIQKFGGCNEKLFIEDFSLVLNLARFGSFCFVDNITSFGPKNDEDRIMNSKKTQLIHDYNAALYYFLKKNKLEESLLKIACKKSIGRSEKWYRREKRKTKFNRMSFLRICLFLGSKNYLNLIKESCIFIYQHSKKETIRYKIDDYSP
tara:strand:+ start:89 stop:1024 length:936 start_codon:yes stop_codon:yes gene_type:complete